MILDPVVGEWVSPPEEQLLVAAPSSEGELRLFYSLQQRRDDLTFPCLGNAEQLVRMAFASYRPPTDLLRAIAKDNNVSYSVLGIMPNPFVSASSMLQLEEVLLRKYPHAVLLCTVEYALERLYREGKLDSSPLRLITHVVVDDAHRLSSAEFVALALQFQDAFFRIIGAPVLDPKGHELPVSS